MKRIMLTLGSGVALVAGLVGVQYWLRPARPAQAAAASVAAEPRDISALLSEVQALRGEVRTASAQTQLLQSAARERQPEGARADDRLDPEPTDEERAQAKAAEEQRREQYLVQLGRAFNNEVVDRSWSTAVTAQLEAALKADDVQIAPKSVECRSSSCRLELENEDASASKKGFPLMLNRVGGALPNTIAHQESDGRGGTSTVVYMFRGQLPPEPAAG